MSSSSQFSTLTPIFGLCGEFNPDFNSLARRGSGELRPWIMNLTRLAESGCRTSQDYSGPNPPGDVTLTSRCKCGARGNADFRPRAPKADEGTNPPPTWLGMDRCQSGCTRMTFPTSNLNKSPWARFIQSGQVIFVTSRHLPLPVTSYEADSVPLLFPSTARSFAPFPSSSPTPSTSRVGGATRMAPPPFWKDCLLR